MQSRLDKKPEYTPRQGQFLAFIHYYAKLNGCPPAENDLARYFKIMPPAAHRMVVTLEQHGLIERVPGQARSIRLLLARKDLPDLA
jgi:repressor LexA